MVGEAIDRRLVRILARLSVLGVIFVFVGIALNRSLQYWYLPYNLALAWVPLLVAAALISKKFPPLVQALLFAMWLAFLPNAYYLITDFIHINETLRVSYNFDTVMLFTIITPGIAAGAYSLVLIDRHYFKKFTAPGRLAALGSVALLVSVGVYLGRTLRWNSWDLVLHPLGVLKSFTNVFTSSWSLSQFLIDVAAFLTLVTVCHVVLSQYNRP